MGRSTDTKIAKEQVEMRRVANAVPVYSVEEVLRQQAAKGEQAGIQMIMGLPQVFLDGTEADIKALLEEMRDE